MGGFDEVFIVKGLPLQLKQPLYSLYRLLNLPVRIPVGQHPENGIWNFASQFLHSSAA